MIWIDFEHKLPTDTNISGWTPWTQQQWDDWQKKSRRLVRALARLENKGRRDLRNRLIDKHSSHWAKLKPWLQALSGNKCWFSEARELYSHYDVEHFRPKKEAWSLDATVRDGYWWLAFDYMNFRLCGNVGNRKKGGWFPLREGSLCSTYVSPCEESESAYLLDPIDPDDVALIAFDEEGKIIPMPGSSEWERLRVSETVKRLKLNEHAQLAEARRKIWQKVNGLIETYGTFSARAAAGINPAAKQRAMTAVKEIRHMIQPTEELSSVAKWCVLVRNDQRLNRLIA